MVEACAGSGKTWLLTSRLIRILLANPKLEPGKILAITFTNAAAAEIDDRLRERITAFDEAEDDRHLDKLLGQIGVDGDESTRLVARRLRRRFLLARPRLAARTFHGWFNQLGQSLPWAARLTLTAQIASDTSMLRNWAWQACIGMIDDDPKLAKALQHLLKLHVPDQIQQTLDALLDKRLAWEMMFKEGIEHPDAAANFMSELDKSGPADPQPEQLLDSEKFLNCCQSLLAATEPHIDKKPPLYLTKFVNALDQTLAKRDLSSVPGLYAAIFTQKDTLQKNLEKKLTDNQAQLSELAGYMQHCEQWRRWRLIRPYNENIIILGRVYAQAYAQAKVIHGAVDYADLEITAMRSMRHEETATALVAGGEHNYAHILIDEFQDTSPSQWVIMRNWLDTAHGTNDQQPRVFIVGDPKQSIYSFQGGDPEVMSVASKYLRSKYQASIEKFNTTRRCCPTVLEGVNAAFGEHGEHLAGFSTHDTIQTELPGQIIVASKQQLEKTPKKPAALRNPLLEPPADPQVGSAELEGEQLVELLNRVRANWAIDNDGEPRRCRFEDVMLLFPFRAGAETVIQTLRGAGLPCAPLGNDNRLHYLECRDVIALLRTIYDPANALALAHVLRSPIFGIDENDLWEVFAAGTLEIGQDKKIYDWYRGMRKARGSKKLTFAQKMLAKWRYLYLNGKLPAHEMLAQCFFDADIVNRYAKALPEEMRQRAVENLQWILNYAIEADGGHHVHLADYVQHLEQLGEQTSLNTAFTQPAGMIKTCTVHGAKGLESPVVVIVNSNAGERTNVGNLLLRWENDAETNTRKPVHFSFFPFSNQTVTAQDKCKEDNQLSRRREFLNMMYVAMTRAKQVLALTVRPVKTQRPGLNWHDFTTEALEQLSARKEDEYLVLGDEPAKPPPHETATEKLDDAPMPTQVRKHGKINPYPTDQERYGTLLHDLLALHLSGVTDSADQLSFLGINKEELDKARAHVERIIAGKEFAALLKNCTRCEFEVPVVSEKGTNLRIDCLLENKDEVWILDFKASSAPDTATYQAQLAAYKAAVRHGGEKRPINVALVSGKGVLQKL